MLMKEFMGKKMEEQFLKDDVMVKYHIRLLFLAAIIGALS